MPYTRRLRPRKIIKKRRTTRRRRTTTRLVKSPRMGVLNVVRKFNYGFWQPDSVSTNGFWRQYGFALSDMPSYTEFTPVFDQYRINAIKVEFLPRHDMYPGNNTSDVTLPNITNQSGVNLHIIKDQRTTVSPSGLYTRANLNTFLENGKCKSYNGNKKVTVYFKPATPEAIGSGFEFKWSPWLQTTGAANVHYGFHVFAQDVNLNGSFGQNWDIFVTYYMQFKGLK